MFTSEKIQYRVAKENDLPAILAIYNEAIEHTTSVYDYQPHTMSMRKKWYSEKQAAKTPIIVAEIDGTVVGFSTYGPFRPWAAFKYTMEQSVYIHSKHWGKGIAQNLLKNLQAAAEKNEVRCLIAAIDTDNKVSIYLHEKLGYTAVGELKEVGYKFGQWRNIIFMQKMLTIHFEPNEVG